jgi:hypothetical protein
MGIVYGAYDDRLDRSVAIKRIRETSDDAAIPPAFARGERSLT